MNTASLVFWASFLLVGYIYAGYPPLVRLMGRFVNRPVNKHDHQPKITVIISAHNEEDCIRETLGNKLGLDYPRTAYEILVVSDGSTDRTEQIVEEVAQTADVPIRLFNQTPRQGKSAALNLGVQHARGAILVFSDANSLYDRDALLHLARNFADKQVGYVTGKMVYRDPEGTLTGQGCQDYMRYENNLRRHETRLGSVVGVDGGIDAMRKDLFRPLRPEHLPDFVPPLSVVAAGFRVVYEPAALIYEDALPDPAREYKMRVRVSLRSLWTLWEMRRLLNPVRYGWFSWQLLSHKVLRYLAFIPLLTLLGSNALLLGSSPFYVLTFSGQVAVYVAAILGLIIEARATPKIFSVPYYFALVNLASAHAALKFLKGEKIVIWNPRTG